MCNALTVHLNDEPIYDIFFANDFNSLPELLAGQGIADRRVCIVTESNVAPLYLDEIRNQLDGKCKELISIIFEAGESQKNLDTVKMIYEKLILAKFDRSSGGSWRWRDGRYNRIYCCNVSQRHRLCTDTYKSSGTGGQQYWWKDRR